MILADALNKIRSVTIYHDCYNINAFFFFDKDGTLLWGHERFDPDEIMEDDEEIVVLEENEVIVGAKVKPGNHI
jgi:hypothetical protein